MVQPQGPDQPQQPPQPYGQQPYQPPQQPGQYQQPPQPYGAQPGQSYPGQYQQGGTPAKKVGPGGCLTSIALVVLSIVAFVGLFVWGFVGTFNSVKDAPRVPVGQSATVNITKTGQTYVILSNFDSTSTPLPVFDPTVVITAPDGRTATLSNSTTSSGSSSGADFRTLGSFNADVTGTYTIESEATGVSSGSGLTLSVTDLDLGGLGAKLLAAVGIGFVLFVAAVIVFVIWLVRRSKAKKGYA